MEWIKYTLLCIKRNLNIFILILLILTAVLLYKFANLKLDLIALIFSPLFTLSILPIVEEYKSKWNTKYETFKFLYANRDNLVNYNVVQHLNLIDIVFINDKKVRKCWKELREMLKINATYLEQKSKYAELISTMAVCLGLNKDIGYIDIIDTYYPNGLSNIDQQMDTKTKLEIDFYTKACQLIDKHNEQPNQENKV